MQTSLNFLICSLIIHFNFVRLNASELLVSVRKRHMQDISATLIPCKNDSDCPSLQGAVCIDKYCNCNGTKFCPNVVELKVTKLGEQCRQNSICHIEHSLCRDEICQCVTGMVPSLNKKECLKESLYNCTTFGNCSQPIVIDCPKGFVQNSDSTKCLEVIQIPQSVCREDAQCSKRFGKAVCINATCQCQPSYQYDISGKCINLEINCREDKDCLDNEQEDDSNLLSCVMGVCKSCSEDAELCKSRPETGPCLELSRNGSSANIESGTCKTGRCECPEERQFCVNSAILADAARIGDHPLQKYFVPLMPKKNRPVKKYWRPFKKVTSPNKKVASPNKKVTNPVKEDTSLVKEDTSPDMGVTFSYTMDASLNTEDTQNTEQPNKEVPTRPKYWYQNRNFVTILCSFIVHSLFSTTVTVMTVFPRRISHLYATYAYPVNVVIVINCLFFSLRVDQYIFEVSLIMFIMGIVVIVLLVVRKLYYFLISFIYKPKEPTQYSSIHRDLFTSDESTIVDESESRDEFRNESAAESIDVKLNESLKVVQPIALRRRNVGQGRGRAGRRRRN